MNYKKIINTGSLIIASILSPSLTATVEPREATHPKTDGITQAIQEGNLLLNTRLRYENADQRGLKESNAITARVRLGWQSGVYHGFQVLAEFEGTHALNGESDYDPYPPAGTRTLIADPENAELNRLQLSWTAYDTTLTAGRQRIILDNARFIGNVGWRQNEQSYDGVTITNKSIENFTLTYGWIDQVNRIFGLDAPTGALKRLHTKTHLGNVSYNKFKYAKITLYDYYMNATNAAASSSNTLGASLTGKYDIDEHYTLSYRAEYASQKDAANNTSNYNADYYHLYADVSRSPLTIGFGYEVLGSDKGSSFQTPLATLHKFNGFADVFLTTPGAGLEDIYITGIYKAPYNITLSATYHEFDSDTGGTDQGDELDLVAAYKYNKHWSSIAKYADYHSGGGVSPADISRFSLELNYLY